MIYLRRVVGRSMQPSLKDGQLVLFAKWPSYSAKDVVLADTPGRQVVKRIKAIDSNIYQLVGDNSASNKYQIQKQQIKAKLIWPFGLKKVQ